MPAISARPNTVIKQLEKDAGGLHASFVQATAIRAQQLAKFNADETCYLESVSALEAATTVPSEFHGGASVPTSDSHMLRAATTLQRVMREHAETLQCILSPSGWRAAIALLLATEDERGATLAFRQ